MTPNQTRFFVLIPCAGAGSRAGTAIPKQYQAIADVPMVVHTLRVFADVPRIHQGLLVISQGDGQMAGVLAQFPQPLFLTQACGGATRAESVLNGLHALLAAGALEADWVLVHDAARCLLTAQQVNDLIDACQDDAVGGLLAAKLADTLKVEAMGRVATTVDRADKWLAQTPQMFKIGLLIQALTQAGGAVTDESSAVELMGLNPKLVETSAQNFKVTYPQDFELAQAVLAMRQTKE